LKYRNSLKLLEEKIAVHEQTVAELTEAKLQLEEKQQEERLIFEAKVADLQLELMMREDPNKSLRGGTLLDEIKNQFSNAPSPLKADPSVQVCLSLSHI
jgi:hypothetical protein